MAHSLSLKPFYEEQGIEIYQGDALAVLRTLPSECVQTVCTSPPYWGLRDYQIAGQLGLEPTPELYVAAMVEVFREVRRVLREDGTCWLNLGDSYAGGGNYRGMNSESTLAPKQASNRGARGLSQQLGAAGKEFGIAPKNLVGIPWRVAFALQADGWYLRCDIIWSKPNPMPESVTDRPTKSHEYLFLLSKNERYYYDAEAIAEVSIHAGKVVTNNNGKNGQMGQYGQTRGGFLKDEGVTVKETRNRRSVWEVCTVAYPESHFATFPPKLVEPCILAGSKVGDTILDPFHGAGTTGMVAQRFGRQYIGIELNQAYIDMSLERLRQTALPL